MNASTLTKRSLPRCTLCAIAAVLVAWIIAMGVPQGLAHAQDTRLTTAAQTTSPYSAIEPGVYYLKSSLSGNYMLDVSGASTKSGANIQIYASNATLAQKWRIAPAKGGGYTLQCLASGKYLDLRGAQVYNGSNIHQYVGNGTVAQRWYFKKVGNYYTIVSSKNKSYTVDVTGARAASGTNVQLYKSNGTAAQKWALIRADTPPTGACVIYSMLSPGSVCVDIPSASGKGGVQAQVYAANETVAQRFYLRQVGNGNYAIQCVCSGLYLADASGKVVQKARNGKNDQLWRPSFVSGDFAFTNVATGRRLAVANGKAANGTKLITTKAANSKAQCFRILNTTLIPNGYYVVRNGSGSVLGTAGGSWASTANVQVQRASGRAEQTWNIVHTGGNQYKLLNDCSGKALDVTGASKKSGVNVQQYFDNGTVAQRWTIGMNADGTVTIANKGSGLMLEAANGKVGANVRQASKRNGASVQLWTLSAAKPTQLSGNDELDAYVRKIAKANGYNFKRCYDWMGRLRGIAAIDGSHYHGVMDKGEMTKYALYVKRTGKADCFGHAALLTWLARACGYNARTYVGTVQAASGRAEHGWVEVIRNGTTYICDSRMRSYIPNRNWYMVTYANAPAYYYR